MRKFTMLNLLFAPLPGKRKKRGGDWPGGPPRAAGGARMPSRFGSTRAAASPRAGAERGR